MSASQSQISSQALDPEWTAIPLEKFSYAVSAVGAATHHWVHDTRRDELFLVFRPERLSYGDNVYESRLMMKVSAGGEVLERRDVGELVTLAEDHEKLVQIGQAASTIEAPVHVVIRLPCVAVRYPATPTMVRRIQMRFKTESDYQKVIDIFKNLKFPMRNATIKGPPKATGQPARPASTSVLQQPDRNLSSYQQAIPSVQTMQSSSLAGLQNCTTRLISAEQSPFFNRSQSASSGINHPGSAVTFDRAWDPVQSTTPESIYFARPAAKTHRVNDSVASVSPSFLSQVQKNVKSYTNQTIHHENTTKGSLLPRGLQTRNGAESWMSDRGKVDVFESLVPSSQRFSIASESLQCSDGVPQTRRAKTTYTDLPSSNRDTESQPLGRESIFSDFVRPVSAPVVETHDSLSQWIPPRRALPFPTPRAVPNSRTPNSDLAQPTRDVDPSNTSETDEVFQVLTPKLSSPLSKGIARRPSQRKSTERQAAAKNRMQDENRDVGEEHAKWKSIREHEDEPSPLAAKSAALSRPSTAPGLRSKATTITNRKRPGDTDSSMALNNKQPKIMVDHGTQTQTLSGRDHTIAMERTVSATNSEQRIPTPPQTSLNEIEAFVLKHKNRPHPIELWETPGYNTASPEERQAMVNDFICENLDNEDFLKLCEDTREVWRRTGLGL